MDNAEVALVELIRTHGVIRSRDLASLGIPRVALTRAVRRGHLVRVSRGVYGLREFRSEHGTLAAAASRIPRGVICLLSALQFHGLTTQAPFEVWVAVANKAAAPQIDYPPVRIVRFSDATLSLGVEEHTIDGVAIRVTSIAKTVVDCFKFRNKVGLDVALESLREAWRDKRVTSQDIWHCAKVCRVANVMRPYLESLT